LFLEEISFLFILTHCSCSFNFSRKSRRQSLNCQRTQPVGVKHFALDHNPRNAYTVENLFGKPYAVVFAEDKIRLSALVGDKHQRTASGCAHLRAKGVIVSVPMIAKVTIRIGDFASDVHGLPLHRLSYEQIDVPLLCHSPRSCQIGDHALHLRKWHAVQTMPVSELESTQCQSRDCEYLNHSLSTGM
jgi:hypothetical protein